MSHRRVWVSLVVLSSLMGACASIQSNRTTDLGRSVARAAPHEIEVGEEYIGGLWRTGPTYVSGQPTEAALRALPSRGVRAVINIRTPSEMEDRERIPFDEREVVESLGLAYVNIPTNGSDYAYSPEQLEQFAAAMEQYDGEVLLHCTVGGRASHMWAAFAHRYGGLSVSEAWARGKQMNIGAPPMERFLGTTFEVRER